MPYALYALLLPFAALALLIMIGSFIMVKHRRRQLLHAGTAPNNFPPERVYSVGVPIVASKTGNTGAFSTTTFFTAPTAGLYLISWLVRINSTDAAGSITATVTAPASVAIPGVQAAPATPSDGHGPGGLYNLPLGGLVTVAVAVSGLTGTNFDVFVSITRAQ